MGDNGEWWGPLIRWLRPNPPSDAKPSMSGEEKAKLRAARKRQRQARKR